TRPVDRQRQMRAARRWVMRTPARGLPPRHRSTAEPSTAPPRAGNCPIFRFEPVLDHLELQRTDGAQERGALRRLLDEKRLHNAFLEQLFETLAKALELGGGWALQPGKAFGGKTGNFAEAERGVFGQGIADAEIRVPYESDDIAGIGFVHR